MLHILKDKIVIEIPDVSPAENIGNIKKAIIGVLQNVEPGLMQNGEIYWLLRLLEEITLSPEQLKCLQDRQPGKIIR